jgi:hypothetical protein
MMVVQREAVHGGYAFYRVAIEAPRAVRLTMEYDLEAVSFVSDEPISRWLFSHGVQRKAKLAKDCVQIDGKASRVSEIAHFVWRRLEASHGIFYQGGTEIIGKYGKIKRLERLARISQLGLERLRLRRDWCRRRK